MKRRLDNRLIRVAIGAGLGVLTGWLIGANSLIWQRPRDQSETSYCFLQTGFDDSDSVGEHVLSCMIDQQLLIDQGARHLGPKQSGQISLDAVSQPSQFCGIGLLGAHTQVFQRSRDVLLGHIRSYHAPELL